MTVIMHILIAIVAAKIAAELAERVKVPAVVGEIIAGLIIGPSALGLLPRDDTLMILGEIGVILLLFDVGLEIDLGELLSVGESGWSNACRPARPRPGAARRGSRRGRAGRH